MKTKLDYIKDAISNNTLWEYMGWDLKHGPTEEELDALPDAVKFLLSTPRQQRVPL